MRALIEQFLKFGIVGIIAFGIDFGVMVALTELAHLNPVLSAAISFVASVVFNYYASMRYVFTHRNDITPVQEFVTFIVLSVIGLLLNEAVMVAGVEMLSINYMLTKIVATALVMLWNFWSRRRWLDAGSRPASEDSERR